MLLVTVLNSKDVPCLIPHEESKHMQIQDLQCSGAPCRLMGL